MRKLCFTLSLIAIVVLAYFEAVSWGRDGHAFINRSVVRHLPNQMMLFIQDSAFFASHASDADGRKSSDTAEAPKHFMDIDDYPDFQNLTHNLDSLILQYGWTRVKRNGISPWAAKWSYDSLVVQLARGDWNKAKLTASDLGHYVGDQHQPLHNAKNYDGQLSGNNGIHARYESTMITKYLSALTVVPDSVRYIVSRLDFIFSYVLASNSLVDSVLHADTYAKTVSGWNGRDTVPASYYTALWNYTDSLTLAQMQRGTKDLASLWYSAWVDAGLIRTTSVLPAVPTMPADFSLAQNYPNPFNPSTTISYTLPVGGTVSLKVFSADGKEVATLVQENQSVGEHSVRFVVPGSIASGVYFYTLRLGNFSQTKKLVFLK